MMLPKDPGAPVELFQDKVWFYVDERGLEFFSRGFGTSVRINERMFRSLWGRIKRAQERKRKR
jgi:hypothetical protein